MRLIENRQCAGFIFLFTLNIIAVISMLLLYCMQHVLLYHKALNQRTSQSQRFYQLEHLARSLATEPEKIATACFIHQMEANRVLEQLMINKGCTKTIGNNSYRYLLEDLGDYPCLIIGGIHASHHLRISLLLLANEEHQGSLLQIRVIKPTMPLLCTDEKKPVFSGISSWRYLADSKQLFRHLRN